MCYFGFIIGAPQLNMFTACLREYEAIASERLSGLL